MLQKNLSSVSKQRQVNLTIIITSMRAKERREIIDAAGFACGRV
jgi:hypothetical protein